MSWTPTYTFENIFPSTIKAGDTITFDNIDPTILGNKTDITVTDSSGTRIINMFEVLTMMKNNFSLGSGHYGLYLEASNSIVTSLTTDHLYVSLFKITNDTADVEYNSNLSYYYSSSGIKYQIYISSQNVSYDQSTFSDTIIPPLGNPSVFGYGNIYVQAVPTVWPLANGHIAVVSVHYKASDTGQPDDGDGKNSTEPNHGGDGDNTSDNTTILIPAFNGAGHFNRMYAISETQVKNVRNFLWNGNLFDITTFQKLFSNPMEAVISLRYFPFDLQTHDSAGLGASESMRIGNIDIGFSGLPVLSTYNQIFDLGSFDLTEYFGTAMDYEPYQKLAIYLPYVGIKPININNFMGSTIGIKYIVDIMTGECIATLWHNDQLLEHYEGKIGINISVSASNDAQYNAGLLMSVVSGGVAIAGALTANPMIATGGILSAAKSVASNQHHYTSGGLNSPNSSLYMPQYPYLIIQRPVQSLSSNFQLEEGYPLNAKETLSDLSGMTICSNPILTGLTCTDEEKSEVYSILTSGVIL